MSLVTVKTSAAAATPRVWMEGPVLCARTALLWQFVSLGSYCKHVEVSPIERTISIRTRLLWVLQTERELSFDDVSHIEYRFSSMVTSWSVWRGARDTVEQFSIALALHDRSEVALFDFDGDGARNTGWLGVLAGDSIVDLQGDQKERSLSYLDALMELTGKGLSRFSKPRRPASPR